MPFFWGDPTHVGDDPVVGPQAQLGSVPVGSESRAEPRGVDSPGPQSRVRHAAALEMTAIPSGGSQHESRLAIEPAEIDPADLGRPRHSISGRILFVVRMGRRDDRGPQGFGGAEPGVAHGPLSGQVNDIGVEAPEVGIDGRLIRRGPLNLRRQEERPARTPVHFGAVGHLAQRILWRVDPNRVAAVLERGGGSGQCRRNSAHHRPIHFREYGDSHGSLALRPSWEVGPGSGPEMPDWRNPSIDRLG